MPRQPRVQFEGAIYHLTARGNRRQAIFVDERDRELFLQFLTRVVRRFGWRCHAYCLMTNHYHLLVETPQPNLSVGMHLLNSTYAHRFNWRHGFTGHLFEARFHSVLVERESHFLELLRYIPLNPVRAGLSPTAGDWRWSSYAAATGRATPPPFLTLERILWEFGPGRRRAEFELEHFVHDAPARAGP